MNPMARNTQVSADHNAPPVTQLLANFVANHPSRGWSDAVEHEAHCTFMNWLGCAVGGAHHETADSALAAVQMLQPAAQASVPGRQGFDGRACKVHMTSAALINGITSHTRTPIAAAWGLASAADVKAMVALACP